MECAEIKLPLFVAPLQQFVPILFAMVEKELTSVGLGRLLAVYGPQTRKGAGLPTRPPIRHHDLAIAGGQSSLSTGIVPVEGLKSRRLR